LDAIQQHVNSEHGCVPVAGMKKKPQRSELLLSSCCCFLRLLAQSSL